MLRPRLLEVLRGRWTRRATVVVAGAGAGKSTLLAQALADNELDPQGMDVWVRCVAADGAASHLGEALRRALGVEDPPEEGADALADAIAEAVLAHAPVAVTVVLDDLHLVPDDSEGAELVGLLLERLPASGHLLLGSRRKPAFPLARLVAQGDAVVLREGDLTFTPDELGAFAELRGLSARDRDVLTAWPALAELMASAGPTVVRDYLWEEVLAALPEPRRRALAAVAAIGGGDAALVGVALDAEVDLEELAAEVPLVSSTASGWVELHALWDEHLASLLDPDERRAIQGRAGAALLERGDRDRAFGLLAAAGAVDELRALVLDVGTNVYLPISPDRLSGWLSDLEQVAPTAPETLLLRGLVAKEQAGELGQAMGLLEHALAEFAARGQHDGELACLVHLSSIGFSLDDADLLARTIERGTALAEAGHGPAGPISAIGRATVADFFGEHEEALRLLDSAPLLASGEWNAIRSWMRAELLEATGHPVAALETIAACDDRHGGLIRDQLAGARIQALWSAGEVDEVVAGGGTAFAGASFGGSTRTAQRAHTLAARYEAHLGHAEAADRHLAAIDRHPPADRVLGRRRHVARAVRRVLAGDEAGAADELAWLIEDGEVNDFFARQKTILRALPLVYVLLPPTRPVLDAAPLGPSFAEWRQLAATLVAARERDDLQPVRDLGPIRTGSTRAALPLPWLIELAVALTAVDRADGRELLTAAGAVGHPHLVELADDGPLAATARRLLGEIPRPPDQPVEVRLLGPPELLRGDDPEPPAAWRRERVRQLLAFLILHPTTNRDVVADALWPELDADAAGNNLRGTLSHLLGALQPDRRGREPSYFVGLVDRTMTLTGTDRLRVDVWELERHLDEAERAERAGAPSVALHAYRQALALWRGPFAGGAAWAWAEQDAERITSRFAVAAARAAALTLAGGDGAEAERLAGIVLELDPWSEQAYRVMATAQLERGDRSGARLTLDRCRKVLADLGVDPDPATVMVERRLTLGPEDP